MPDHKALNESVRRANEWRRQGFDAAVQRCVLATLMNFKPLMKLPDEDNLAVLRKELTEAIGRTMRLYWPMK